jgi:hypothetical protein
VKEIIDLALDLADNCAASYAKARPEVRKMWNRAFFRTLRVRDGAIADFAYEEPFASLFGSHKGSMVEVRGLEPLASSVRVISGPPPCRPAFPQVAPDRQRRS